MRNCVTAVIRPGVVDVVIRENEKKAVLYATPYECHVLSNNGVVITPEELNHFTCEARKNYKQYIWFAEEALTNGASFFFTFLQPTY